MSVLPFDALYPSDEAIPSERRFGPALHQRQVLIDGVLETWDGPVQEVDSPMPEWTASGHRHRVLGSIPRMDEASALRALAAAERAWDRGRGVWPRMHITDRIRSIEDLAWRMQEREEDIVRSLMWEVGKSWQESRMEFRRTIDYIMDTIDAVKEMDRVASRFVMKSDILAQIRRTPLGIVLCMGPYNYPLNETFTTLIPALVMGNPVVMKPPKRGALLYAHLLDAFRDAFPPGVVNTVYGEGDDVIRPLLCSGKVDVLAFIGTSAVAGHLKSLHPKPTRLRCIFGLEAKNAAVILADADLDTAVKECVMGALAFNGQRCTALKMLFVHEDCHADFLSRFVEAVSALRQGPSWQDGVTITPLPDQERVDYVRGLLDDAIARGARIVNPGGGECRGTLMAPAVVDGVTPTMRLFHEEQFGPLVPIARFREPEDSIAHISASQYGQQASLFGRDPNILSAMIDVLVHQVCRVNLNTKCQRGPDIFPFSGRKDSAEGTRSVEDALRAFSIRAVVAARDTAASKDIVRQIVRGHSSTFLSTDFIL